MAEPTEAKGTSVYEQEKDSIVAEEGDEDESSAQPSNAEGNEGTGESLAWVRPMEDKISFQEQLQRNEGSYAGDTGDCIGEWIYGIQEMPSKISKVRGRKLERGNQFIPVARDEFLL